MDIPTPKHQDPQMQAHIDALAAMGYSILEPFSFPDLSPQTNPGPGELVAAVLDTETTGIDLAVDEPIELGIQKVIVGPRGMRTVARLSLLREPGVPIQAEAQRVHGITMEELKGKTFDEDAVRSILSNVHFVVAHKADFDAPMMSKLFPWIANLPWACSLKDIDWLERGMSSRTEEHLAWASGLKFEAHRVDADTAVLAEILTRQRVWKELYRAASAEYVHLWALDTPYDSSPILKGYGGFVWNDPRNAGAIPGGVKAWHRVMPRSELADVAQFLIDRVYLKDLGARGTGIGENAQVLVDERIPNRFVTTPAGALRPMPQRVRRLGDLVCPTENAQDTLPLNFDVSAPQKLEPGANS